MVYTITFNPSIDYFVELEDFEKGNLYRTEKQSIYPGGKGINVSFVLNKCGVENTAITFLSGQTGVFFQNIISQYNLNTDYIILNDSVNETRINIKISSDNNTRNKIETEINGNGPEISQVALKKLFDRINTFNKNDYLVISGSAQKSVPDDTIKLLVESANKKGVLTIVDTSGEQLKKAISAQPFLIKPNIKELCQIEEKEISSTNDIIKSCFNLQTKGARNILVSLGDKGGLLVCEDKRVFSCQVPDKASLSRLGYNKLFNTIGAGDSVVGGFISQYIKSCDIEKAFKVSIATGVARVYSPWFPEEKDIQNIESICHNQPINNL